MSATLRANGARALGAIGLAAALALVGCAVSPGGGERSAATRAEACRAGDRPVNSESDCLQDDAACYVLANGDWCTGPRDATCPAGSTALPVGQACPPGAVCFGMGESLECLAG